VVYTYIAFVVAFGAMLPITRRTAVIASGIALTVLVGISRVYLHAHYASDVLGGWALGVAVFSILSATALVIAQVRRSRGEGPGPESSRFCR